MGTEQVLHFWRDHAGRTSRHDPNYSDNTFLDIKLHYFLGEDRLSQLPLVIWGAGKKGKALASLLVSAQQNFIWITGNENKVGKDIYGVKLERQTSLDSLEPAQIIIMISSPDDRIEIKEVQSCLLYTSPSPRDRQKSRMPSSA